MKVTIGQFKETCDALISNTIILDKIINEVNDQIKFHEKLIPPVEHHKPNPPKSTFSLFKPKPIIILATVNSHEKKAEDLLADRYRATILKSKLENAGKQVNETVSYLLNKPNNTIQNIQSNNENKSLDARFYNELDNEDKKLITPILKSILKMITDSQFTVSVTLGVISGEQLLKAMEEVEVKVEKQETTKYDSLKNSPNVFHHKKSETGSIGSNTPIEEKDQTTLDTIFKK